MTLQDFEQSLANEQPSADLPLHLQALWYDRTGNWKAAHELIDQLTDLQSAMFMLTCTVRKETFGMQITGTKGLGSADPRLGLMRNGKCL